MPIAADSLIQVSIKAETLFTIGPLQVTNSMVGALLASAILLGASWWFMRGASLVPSRFQSAVELPIEWLSGIVAESTSRWRSYVGLVVGLFLMILIANWLGVLPGVGTIGLVKETEAGKELVPFVRPAAADLNFTLGLALITFVVFVWWAVRLHGPIGYLKELAGEPRYMAPLMFPIEMVGNFARMLSLGMRLFGNIFGEHSATGMFMGMLPFVIPWPMMALGIFGAVLQTFVFIMLTMVYLSGAIAAEEH